MGHRSHTAWYPYRNSLTTRPEGPGGPGSPTAPVGPGRPWKEKLGTVANPQCPHNLPQQLHHSPVLGVLSLQVPPVKDPETIVISPIIVGIDMRGIPLPSSSVHPIPLPRLHSPSGQKAPGVLQGQQDPRKRSVKAEHRVQCCLSGFQDSHEQSVAYQRRQITVPFLSYPH